MTDDIRPEPVAGPDALVDALGQVAFRTMAVLSRVAADHDLSLTQLRMLGILRDRRLTMTELAGYLGLDRSTITGLADRARSRGLLERARSETDGRSVEVFISAAGAELARAVQSQVARSLAPMTSSLVQADQDQLRTLLEHLLDPRH